jgi:hypothetical protein
MLCMGNIGVSQVMKLAIFRFSITFFSLQQTTDNRQQTTDNRQQTTDNRQKTTDNRIHIDQFQIEKMFNFQQFSFPQYFP